MANSVFPASKAEALALLYVQSRDISEVTPEELCEMYEKAHEQTKTYFDKHKPRGGVSFHKGV